MLPPDILRVGSPFAAVIAKLENGPDKRGLLRSLTVVMNLAALIGRALSVRAVPVPLSNRIKIDGRDEASDLPPDFHHC